MHGANAHILKKASSNRKITVLSVVSILTIVSILAFSGVFSISEKKEAIITVSFIAALVGGMLALISPCSAAMLPVFFAYSFKEKRELIKMTFVFYLGLATLFVPLGFSATYIARLFFNNQLFFFNTAGVIFILLGVVILFGVSWQWLPKSLRMQHITSEKKGVGTIYVMGLLFSFATGTCSAPIIGGILTLASTAGNGVTAVLLLLTFAFGMVVPMLIIAWFFDRYNFAGSALVRGKSWGITLLGKKFFIHTTNIITSALFIGVGLLFIITKGTNAFLIIFGDIGLIDLYYDLNTFVLTKTASMQNWILVTVFAVVGTGYGIYAMHKKKELIP